MVGKRTKDRKKRRMPCKVHVNGRKHSGLVLDLSPTGLFVQTNAKTSPGQCFDLLLSTGSRDLVGLVVEVVRKKVVPPRLLALAQGGVGVRIKMAPEEYFAFLGELGPSSAKRPRFRVHAKQISGPRTRSIEVEGDDRPSAEQAALGELGEGWKILDAAEV